MAAGGPPPTSGRRDRAADRRRNRGRRSAPHLWRPRREQASSVAHSAGTASGLDAAVTFGFPRLDQRSAVCQSGTSDLLTCASPTIEDRRSVVVWGGVMEEFYSGFAQRRAIWRRRPTRSLGDGFSIWRKSTSSRADRDRATDGHRRHPAQPRRRCSSPAPAKPDTGAHFRPAKRGFQMPPVNPAMSRHRAAARRRRPIAPAQRASRSGRCRRRLAIPSPACWRSSYTQVSSAIEPGIGRAAVRSPAVGQKSELRRR